MNHTQSSPEQLPTAYRKEWKRKKLWGLGIGLAMLAAVPLILLLAEISSGHADASAKQLREGNRNPGKNLINAGATARDFAGTMVFLVGSMIGGVGGVLLTVSSSMSLMLGPPKAGKTPIQTLRRFYRGVLGDSLGKDEYSARLAAYACLSSAARENIRAMRGFPDAMDGFCDHWKTMRVRIVCTAMKASEARDKTTLTLPEKYGFGVAVKKPQITPLTDTTVRYEAEVRCETHFGKEVYTISGEMEAAGTRWYLTDARWTGTAVAVPT